MVVVFQSVLRDHALIVKRLEVQGLISMSAKILYSDNLLVIVLHISFATLFLL